MFWAIILIQFFQWNDSFSQDCHCLQTPVAFDLELKNSVGVDLELKDLIFLCLLVRSVAYTRISSTLAFTDSGYTT